MTCIAKRKTIVRAETGALYRGRPLMIELRPYSVYIREKGRRSGYEAPWEAIYEMAAKLRARQTAAEKRQSKQGRATGDKRTVRNL